MLLPAIIVVRLAASGAHASTLSEVLAELRAAEAERKAEAAHQQAIAEAGAASRGAPPDSLGDVAVGSILDRRGYSCEGAACSRAATIGGESGELTVALCGTRVREISFGLSFVQADESSLATAKLAPSLHPAIAPAAAAEAARLSLTAGLTASGWTQNVALNEREAPPGALLLRETWINSDARMRRLLFSAMDMPEFGRAYSVVLLTWPELECTDGL